MPDPRAPSSPSPATAKAPAPRTLLQVITEQGPDRKLLVLGPGSEKLQDSRFSIAEVGADFVAFKLLGDEQLVIPFSSLVSVKVERAQITFRVR
jgi:hypothetical protein